LHRLDLRQCILVGKSVADQTMATRLGMRQVPLDTLVL
jgi:hypothetical protein